MPALQKKHKKSSVHNIKSVMNTRYGLGERIRTSGLLNPIQARYQTALHPDIRLRFPSATDRIIHLNAVFVKGIGEFIGEMDVNIWRWLDGLRRGDWGNVFA